MSLLLHTGSKSIDRNELARVVTPPGLGRFHKPYPFIDYVEKVEDSLAHAGLRVVDEGFGTSNDDQLFFGLLEVESIRGLCNQVPEVTDYRLEVGLRGSHNQRLPRGLAIGSRVLVCDNLCFSGEIAFATKQTTYLEKRLPGLIYDAVQTLPGQFEVQENRFETYRHTELKPRWGDAILVELVRRDCLNPSQIRRAIREWDEPSHEEHAQDGHTLWRLHNAYTEALKPAGGERANVLPAWNRTVPATRFFDEVAGFRQ